MAMLFVDLEKRLKEYAVFFEQLRKHEVELSQINVFNMSTMVSDLIQASWFVNDMAGIAIKDWSVEEEEFLKDEYTNSMRQKLHVDDVVMKVSQVTRRPFANVLMKLISFGYWGQFYEIPEKFWFKDKVETNEEFNQEEVLSEDIPF